MSFLTGRRPDHANIYNFINHFRQADCGLDSGNQGYSGDTYSLPHPNWFAGPVLSGQAVLTTLTRYRSVDVFGCEDGSTAACGASGQCCSLCMSRFRCARACFVLFCLSFSTSSVNICVSRDCAKTGLNPGLFHRHGGSAMHSLDLHCWQPHMPAQIRSGRFFSRPRRNERQERHLPNPRRLDHITAAFQTERVSHDWDGQNFSY